jgi:hypothetical protein
MHIRILILILILALLIPQLVVAQVNPVSPSEMRQVIIDKARTRQKNLDAVRSFFASEHARAALKTGKVDIQKVDQAVATLSPDELARLAERTNRIQADFAGGALTNQELTYIVIALAAAVVVLIAVAA